VTQYYVETFAYSTAYNPTEVIPVESREAADALLLEMADRFQCACMTSDNPNDPIVIRRNHPNPYFPRERNAARAWDAKDPNWRNLY